MIWGDFRDEIGVSWSHPNLGVSSNDWEWLELIGTWLSILVIFSIKLSITGWWWLEHDFFLYVPFNIWDVIRNPLTNSIIFQDDYCTSNQIILGSVFFGIFRPWSNWSNWSNWWLDGLHPDIQHIFIHEFPMPNFGMSQFHDGSGWCW